MNEKAIKKREGLGRQAPEVQIDPEREDAEFLQGFTAAGLGLLAVLGAGAFSGEAHAGAAVQLQQFISADGYMPVLNMNAAKQFTDKWGVSAFGVVTPAFAHMYAGPTFTQAIDWDTVSQVRVSLSAGIETSENPWSFGGSAMAKGQFGEERDWSVLAIGEYGGNTGPWGRSVGKVELPRLGGEHSSTSLGVFAQSYRGVGPYVETQLDDGAVTFWAAPTIALEDGSPAAVVGTQVSF